MANYNSVHSGQEIDAAVSAVQEKEDNWDGKAEQADLSAHIADKDNPHEVDPEQIGAIPATQKGAAGGVAELGADGKVPSDQLPEMNYDPAGSAAAVQQALSGHTGNTSNPHGTTAAQVGAIPTTQKGAAGGVAELDSTGKVPSDQLPEMDYDPAGSAAAVQQALNSHIADKDNPHEVDPEQIGAATRAEGTISLPSTGWTDDTANSGYWYRSVTVSGMLSTDEPHVGLVKSFADADADDAMQEAWDLIKGAESLSGSLRFYALEVPEVAVSLQWEVIR